MSDKTGDSPISGIFDGSGNATPSGRGSSGHVLAITARDIFAQLLANGRRLGTVVAQAAVELRELRGVVAASAVGGVEPGLDRSREKTEHDGCEGDQERDHQLHQRDGLGDRCFSGRRE